MNAAARALASLVPVPEPVEMVATVTAVTGASLTVWCQGASLSGIGHVASYVPVIGDRVVVRRLPGGTWLVADAIAH